MHAIASFIFWMTLGLYLLTLFTVTYVGVYLTYVAIPTLILTGLIMKLSTPKPKHKKVMDDGKKVLKEVGKATHDVLNSTNSFLNDLNSSLSDFNKVNELVYERTESFRNKIRALRLEKVQLEMKLKYSDSEEEKPDFRNKIGLIDREISSHKQSIEKIKNACELEVKFK